MPIPSTPHSQNIAETVQQVDDFVLDPGDEKWAMMLVTTVAPGPHSEGCLVAGAQREICPSSPEWSTSTGHELIAKGVEVETDMLIHDKRALCASFSRGICSCSQGENCSLPNGFGRKM